MRTITMNSILGSLNFGQGTMIVRDVKRTPTLRRICSSYARNLSAKAESWADVWLAMLWQHLPLSLARCLPVGVVAVVTVDGTVRVS